MGFGLLFVPLMGGYLFLTWCNSTRFLVRRQSGHHLLFRSASVGLVLLAVARILEVVAGDLATWPHVVDEWQRAAPFPYVGTTAVAFLLGPTAALATNLCYPESKGAMRAVRRASDYMELLFVESMRSDSLVELTLQSGKAYVGWILNASVPDPERKFVEMLPLASGFRAKENHKLEFTTNYAECWPRPRISRSPRLRTTSASSFRSPRCVAPGPSISRPTSSSRNPAR